jgi:hypothetical protein
MMAALFSEECSSPISAATTQMLIGRRFFGEFGILAIGISTIRTPNYMPGCVDPCLRLTKNLWMPECWNIRAIYQQTLFHFQSEGPWSRPQLAAGLPKSFFVWL